MRISFLECFSILVVLATTSPALITLLEYFWNNTEKSTTVILKMSVVNYLNNIISIQFLQIVCGYKPVLFLSKMKPNVGLGPWPQGFLGKYFETDLSG